MDLQFFGGILNSSSVQHLFEIQLQHLSFIGIFFFLKKAYLEENCHLIRVYFTMNIQSTHYVLTISNSAYVLSFGRILEIYLLSFWKVHLLVLEGHMSLTESSVYLFLLSLNFFSSGIWIMLLHSSCFGFWYLVKPVDSVFVIVVTSFISAHSILEIIFEPILNSLPLIFK